MARTPLDPKKRLSRRVMVSLDEALHRELEDLARANRRDKGELLRMLLEEAVHPESTSSPLVQRARDSDGKLLTKAQPRTKAPKTPSKNLKMAVGA